MSERPVEGFLAELGEVGFDVAKYAVDDIDGEGGLRYRVVVTHGGMDAATARAVAKKLAKPLLDGEYAMERMRVYDDGDGVLRVAMKIRHDPPRSIEVL